METSLNISATGDNLKITPLKCCWDSNWLETQVEVKAGAFAGIFSAYFQTSDFIDLRNNLKKLHSELSYQFEFKPLEGQLEIDVSGDGLGHIALSCLARDVAGIGNSLSFELNLDQTYLPLIIAQLNELIDRFPVVQ